MGICKGCGKEVHNDNDYCKKCNASKRNYRYWAKKILTDLEIIIEEKEPEPKKDIVIAS